MKFFGWDRGRKRDDHPPALKQNRAEKASAGACKSYSSRSAAGSRSDWPPDFGNPVFGTGNGNFSKVQQHAKRCDSSSSTVVVLQEPPVDQLLDAAAAEWELGSSLQESIRVVFSHEHKGLLAIGTFAFNEMVGTTTGSRNPPAADEQGLLSDTDANLEVYDWLRDEPNYMMHTSLGQALHTPESTTVEETDTKAAQAKAADECAVLATRSYQATWAAEKKTAADNKHQKADQKSNELSTSITRPPDVVGLSLFHGLKTQVFPLPPNCWETHTELPIYARAASKHKDFAACTGLACGLFSSNTFRKLRRMWLRGTTSHFDQQIHNVQHPALCYKPHVNCNGQEMVISAQAKDRLANQPHLRRNDVMMASRNGKGKGCASYYRSQHCECNGCKEQYMMDLCAYANQKLRSGCSDENGHWITTDSEYLILEM
ncbi:unnamed protein product [Sphagnum jensenii]|uniref:Uncharacterized protein n=1 Tax=Sphagnum jensenii TaxID=128206 RepID=A0ABP0V719_9BRYO